MTLVEDYLRAVGALLPRETRDDIVAELRDVVLTGLEASETALGRPPTDDETETVLRKIGHPLVVAARYRDEPQFLVGPLIYPFWLLGVKIAVALQCAIAGVGFLVHMLEGEPFGVAFGNALADASEGALTLVGLGTVAAWLAERGTVKLSYVYKWRVRDLKMFSIAGCSWSALRRGTPQSTPWKWEPGALDAPQVGGGLGQIAWGFVLALWWLGPIHVFENTSGQLQALGVDAASLSGFDWRGLKAQLVLPMIAYAVTTVLSGAAAVARPKLLKIEGVLDLVNGAGLFFAAWWLAYASPLAAHLKMESAAQIFREARSAFERGPPLPLPVLLGLSIFCLGLAGVLRWGTGVWKLLASLKSSPFGAAKPHGATAQIL